MSFNILFLTGKGITSPYILADCANSCRKLGCKVESLFVNFSPEQVFKVIEEYKPDIVFTIDYFCFRKEDLKRNKDIVFVSWFVDNPFYFVDELDYAENLISLATDRLYVDMLKKSGFENVFYLPLGTNILRMKKGARLLKKDNRIERCNLSFIGTLGKTYSELTEERKEEFNEKQSEIIGFMVEQKIKRRDLSLQVLFDFFDKKMGKPYIKSLPLKSKAALMYRIDIEASAYFRENFVKTAVPYGICVYGDEGWEKVLRENYKGRIDFDNTGAVYKASKINLNVTRVQIQKGINQRILDISAAGGFFLTDYREDVFKFFDFDVKDLVYSSNEELDDKIKYWLKNDEKREIISKNLFQTVYKKHTYDARMKEFLEICERVMKK